MPHRLGPTKDPLLDLSRFVTVVLYGRLLAPLPVPYLESSPRWAYLITLRPQVQSTASRGGLFGAIKAMTRIIARPKVLYQVLSHTPIPIQYLVSTYYLSLALTNPFSLILLDGPSTTMRGSGPGSFSGGRTLEYYSLVLS